MKNRQLPQRSPKELRTYLITYIDFLNSKSHVESKTTLNKYKMTLELDGDLSSREFTHILKFLERDSEYSRPELRKIFRPIVPTKKKPAYQLNMSSSETASLADFFS